MCLAFGVDRSTTSRRSSATCSRCSRRRASSRRCAACRSSSRSPTRGRRRCAAAPSQEVVLEGDDVDPRPAADPDVLARRRRALHHAAGGDHERPAHGRRATSACTGCRSSAGARLPCTGRSTRTDAPTTSRPTGGSRSRSRSGLDPVTAYSASAPLPKHIDEFMLAGFLRGEPVELVQGEDRRPRSARERRDRPRGLRRARTSSREEGPFGDHTGYYTPPEPFPVFHLTAMTMRRDAIYPSIVVGKPPQEDAWLGKATERIFLPAIRMTVPEIVDYDLPVAGAFHNCCIVSIRKAFPGHAQKVMHAIWGLGMLSLTKCDRRRRRMGRRPRLRGGLLPRRRQRRPGPRRAAHRGAARPPRPRARRASSTAARSGSTRPTRGPRRARGSGRRRSR